ncbi:MAG: LysR family transcriptional regulator [Rhodobacteraceae bacterium]|nr:LysR family transcriptional regulator [Paracoccaceae bacterium]
MAANLRHLRVFLTVAETGSITCAAERCSLSQPAVSQAVAGLEARAGLALFTRRARAMFLTEAGAMLHTRAGRAMARLDSALAALTPRLVRTATRAQLDALIAVCAAQNMAMASRRMGLAQPTVHRAITRLEHEAGRALFTRSSEGVAPARAAQDLARAARLTLAELAQAESDMAALGGQEVGQVVIGAMPLSRSFLLPRALAVFRRSHPRLPVRVLEGTYDVMLHGLRHGEIDFLIGALRDPPPVDDITQETLFTDDLVLLAGAGHPLLEGGATVAALRTWPWLVARPGTPARARFDALFANEGLDPPGAVIETGSVLLMRELLADGRHLACASRAQAQGEIIRGLVQVLDHPAPGDARAIGLTTRRGWIPTAAQAALMDALRRAVIPDEVATQPA